MTDGIVEHKYAIIYELNGQVWTYTSCLFFASNSAAINHFPYKEASVIFTLRFTKIKP